MAVRKVVGARIKRREDPRLITGTATYTDDIKLPGLLYVALVRSPHAHARIKQINVDAARNHPGVAWVVTGAELAGLCGPLPMAWVVAGLDKIPQRRPLAVDKVRHVGDPVVAVVAADRAVARDAAELVQVDYDPLPAVVDMEKAVVDDAPIIHDEVGSNVAYVWAAGGDADAALAASDVVVRQRIVNQRVIPNAMEPRAVVAQYHSAGDQLTVHSSTQVPHLLKAQLAGMLGMSEARVRVVAPEVGGGFGSKLNVYAEEAVCAALARKLGRPVKWVEERRENYLATIHGRDHITWLEVGAKKDGTLTAIKVKTLANMGAYLQLLTPGIPLFMALMLPGCYKFGVAHVEITGVYTTTTPTDAYRGAGRPEATYQVERAIDMLAAELGLDPAELRRRNFPAPDEFPFTTAMGLAYDSGNYEPALARAQEMAGIAQLRQEQALRRAQGGKLLGIGYSSYVEVCGVGPSAGVRGTGLGAGGWESAIVRVHLSGKVTVITGAANHGQGHQTSFAQLVAEQLGCSVDDVEVLHGDTAQSPFGLGTYGSRSMAVGGTAIWLSLEKIKDKAKQIAAHLLECATDDLVYEPGRFSVQGAPARGITMNEIALQAWLGDNLPAGLEPGLEATTFFDPSNFTFPFGTHICVVEIDPETGQVEIVRYISVDDCGTVINPLLAEGQVHGGIAQGVAQALYEEAVYDEGGQLLTGSMMEYTVPTARELPSYELDRTETPSPVNPMGVKGIGEAGTIAASAAVMNAVVDALSHLGIRHIDMPAKPERVWRAIEAAKQGR